MTVLKLEDSIKKAGFDLIIVDEATLQEPQSQRWKVLNRIVEKTGWSVDDDRYTCSAKSVRCVWVSQTRRPLECTKILQWFRDQVMNQVSRFTWVPKPSAVQSSCCFTTCDSIYERAVYGSA